MPLSIRLSGEGFVEIARAFQHMASGGMRDVARRGFMKLGEETYRQARTEVPGSGELARYMKYSVFSYAAGGPQSVAMDLKLRQPSRRYPARIWDYIIKGTRPHVIAPRRAHALHFYWSKAGGDVFFKYVHHPGTKPNDFIARAFSVVKGRYMGATAAEIAMNIVKGLET